MHDPHPTNGPSDPQPVDPAAGYAIVSHFDVAAHRLADGRSAVVLSWTGSAGAAGLVCRTGALRRAVEDPADVVLLQPAGTALDPLLDAAVGCTADTPVLATRLPVTDAIKRVDGRLIAATVDRAALAWAVPPAVLHVATLHRALPAADGAVLRPLTALGAPIRWLGTPPA